jgi:hypothetical protein
MPLSRKRLFTWLKRLEEGSMTICAAAINWERDNHKPLIHIIFDKQVTFADGAFGADGSMWKVKRINAKWCVLFAGELSSLYVLREAIIDAVQYEKSANFREFARLCGKVYRDERKEILKTQVLSDYDVDSYEEYLNLKEDHRALFDAISEQISNLEREWSLLFAGFDDLDEPHIFIVTEKGKIQYCDTPGFACVGSGAWAAYSSLAAHPYTVNLYEGEAIFALLAAKFRAEQSHGVGDSTAFFTIRPTDKFDKSVPGLSPDAVDRFREKWRSLPKVPEGVAEELTLDCRASGIQEFRLKIPVRRRRRKHKRKTRRSTSQTSKKVQ